MNLRNKLSFRSTLLFFCTLTLVATGTYFLFKSHTVKVYNKKLQATAQLAGHFYLERDEMNSLTHRRIEREFRKISDESIRLYRVNDTSLYVADSLDFALPKQTLQNTIRKGTQTFEHGDRQFLSMEYKDNEGDFIILVSGVDTEGRIQLKALRNMLGAFCIAGLVLHYVLTNILARKTFRPFSKLISQVNSIKGDDLRMRLDYPPGRPDEMHRLVAEFNYFLQRLENIILIQRNFLKHASHELKTPLTVIIGDIEVALKQPRDRDEYIRILQSLKKDSLGLKSTTESLLTLSGLEISVSRHMGPVRIDEVIWDLLEKKLMEYPAAKVSVDLKCVTDLYKLIVHGNRELLYIAIGNLVDNALKFSGNETVSVIVDVVEDRLAVYVIDRGSGIPPEDQKHLFELFYRSSRHGNIQGSGIGLYLAKQIAELHDISLEIRSVPGEGTTAVLLFPA